MLDKRVLLEGLEYLEREDQWSVVVGFDTSRPKYDPFGELLPVSAAQALFSERVMVREFRKFLVNGSSGALVRLVPA